MVDPRRVQVESICPDEDLANAGLHWFQVFFKAGSGRCFITSGEAKRLGQLSADWVERALSNLVGKYGTAWLEHALASNPGLQLHYFDAEEPQAARPSRAWRHSQVDAFRRPQGDASGGEDFATAKLEFDFASGRVPGVWSAPARSPSWPPWVGALLHRSSVLRRSQW